jgi:hypothetical protein
MAGMGGALNMEGSSLHGSVSTRNKSSQSMKTFFQNLADVARKTKSARCQSTLLEYSQLPFREKFASGVFGCGPFHSSLRKSALMKIGPLGNRQGCHA